MENKVKESKVKGNDGVLQTYPSFNEIISNPKYNFHLVCPPFEHTIGKMSTSKWDFVVRMVNKMCREMYEIPFYKSFWFEPTDDPFDFDKSINIEGEGFVYDSRGDTHKVDYDTFLKLTLVMYLSFMGISLTDEQYESYLKFRDSSSTIWKILD